MEAVNFLKGPGRNITVTAKFANNSKADERILKAMGLSPETQKPFAVTIEPWSSEVGKFLGDTSILAASTPGLFVVMRIDYEIKWVHYGGADATPFGLAPLTNAADIAYMAGYDHQRSIPRGVEFVDQS